MTHICLTCRRLRAADEPCEVEAAHVVVPIGSDAHLAAVWPDPAPKRPPRNAGVPDFLFGCVRWAGVGIGVTIVACLPFTLCDDHPTRVPQTAGFWIMVGLVSAIVVPALIAEQVGFHVSLRDILRYPFPPRRRVMPRGAARPSRPTGDGVQGTVRGDAILVAPLSGRACLAWDITLVRAGDVYLRASRATDVAVVLGDGTTVRVPGGRIDLDTSPTIDPDAVDPWLATIVAARGSGTADPFPSCHGEERIVAPDDPVTVIGELRPQPAASDAATYREAPPVELVPTGRVVIRAR